MATRLLCFGIVLICVVAACSAAPHVQNFETVKPKDPQLLEHFKQEKRQIHPALPQDRYDVRKEDLGQGEWREDIINTFYRKLPPELLNREQRSPQVPKDFPTETSQARQTISEDSVRENFDEKSEVSIDISATPSLEESTKHAEETSTQSSDNTLSVETPEVSTYISATAPLQASTKHVEETSTQSSNNTLSVEKSETSSESTVETTSKSSSSENTIIYVENFFSVPPFERIYKYPSLFVSRAGYYEMPADRHVLPNYKFQRTEDDDSEGPSRNLPPYMMRVIRPAIGSQVRNEVQQLQVIARFLSGLPYKREAESAEPATPICDENMCYQTATKAPFTGKTLQKAWRVLQALDGVKDVYESAAHLFFAALREGRQQAKSAWLSEELEDGMRKSEASTPILQEVGSRVIAHLMDKLRHPIPGSMDGLTEHISAMKDIRMCFSQLWLDIVKEASKSTASIPEDEVRAFHEVVHYIQPCLQPLASPTASTGTETIAVEDTTVVTRVNTIHLY